ncbi:type III PLP-dependent enzyme [Marivibrio halodurans]|uniref:Type III PLP-dependent enzyme n=1 Tax=Marivibrio halodurans TaxID=2039722 RepID=A0A8J7SI89_9PROT|nr:type III PLP-dependent enzyme [Marivibrio halodurans]MBP5856928.1 type III PLP-dependent enzyme [Marivibrio halodurans]
MAPKHSHFASVDEMVARLQPGYPVYCLRPHELERTARAYLDQFPGRVLYAVKCNPHIEVLKAFYRAGIRHFDTASLAEIALIRENFPHADCYFMHPVKARSAILSAHEVFSVDHYVIDHEAELEKLVDVTGGGDGQVCLVRLVTPQYDALFKLSEKFGTDAAGAVDLLRKVEKAGFQPGLAFHVGSQCRSPQAFRDAIALVGEVLVESGVPIHYLDVGGGFPVPYVDDEPEPLDAYIAAIREGVQAIKLRGDCVLMCEPGRGMVASGMSLVVQVQLRKEGAVYINDGVYHSLSETLTAGVKLPMRLIRPNRAIARETQPFSVYGPTCDCTDVLPYKVDLPADIREGDWIEVGQAGAYSNSMTTQFNGFFPETYVSVDDPPLLPETVRVAAAEGAA